MSSNERKDNKPDGSTLGTAEESRRKLLRKLAAGGVAGAALPAAWSKPVIDSVILPAHAQTTGVGAQTAGPGVIVGGGGGGGTGPGPAPSGSMGRDLIDFFVNPAEAGTNCELECEPEDTMPELFEYCVEIEVSHDGTQVTAVTVSKYCLSDYYSYCEGGLRDITAGSVSLTENGGEWQDEVDGYMMVISNINLGAGNNLADIEWNDISGALIKGNSCDCPCSLLPDM